MPQSDVPSLADAYMQTSPSSPKAKYLWEAFNRAKEYASEARDRTPPLLPMEAESTGKSRRREACDSPATPITPATRRHSLSPEAPRTRRNSEDSYDDRKDPSHPLYQYNYREAYRQHVLQTSKDRAAIEALEDTPLVPRNMPATSPPSSLLDLLPPPSPLVPYPSPSSEQGIHLPAFHPLVLWEPSSSLPRPAFVHPPSPRRCLDNIDPLVAGFATPLH